MKIVLNRYTVMGFVAILLWSTTVGLVRSISEQIGPITAGAAVYLTGGLLSMVVYIFNKDGLRALKNVSRIYLYGCGTLFVIYGALLFLALGMASDHYQTLELGLINYLWPALTILFSLFILSEKARLWLIPGTILALAGVYLVIVKNLSFSGSEFIYNLSSNPLSFLLALTAAVTWALYSNLTRFTAKSGGSGAVPLFILATGVILYFIRYLHPENTVWSAQVIAEILSLGIFTALAYVFWDAAMRKGDMMLVVAFSYLTPFFSTLFASVYLGVMPDSVLWLGCLLIIFGSFISWRSVDTFPLNDK